MEQKAKDNEHILTCVYCGKMYPVGTKPHGEKVLTDHIKTCEKHPMYKLRKALADIIGASTKQELEKFQIALEITSMFVTGREKDRELTRNAVQALLETA